MNTKDSIQNLIHQLEVYCKSNDVSENEVIHLANESDSLNAIFDKEMETFILEFQLNSDIKNRSTTEAILSLLPEDPNNITNLQAFDDYDGFDIHTNESHHTDYSHFDGQPMTITITYRSYN